METVSDRGTKGSSVVSIPPRGLAIVTLVGPAFVWCAEYIGSGEVILSTRNGAVFGTSVAWAIVIGIFLKYWIGMSGARYTVCTGEGMIDMFDRIPGPSHWVVWIVLVAQFMGAVISIGSLASAAGVFVNALIPISPYFGGWAVTIFALFVVWSGLFEHLKLVMTICVALIVLGVIYVAITVFPGLTALVRGFLPQMPTVPAWALETGHFTANPWREVLPLLGWAAGGFASQVWYTYWVLGAGYGAAAGRSQGQPADVEALAALDRGAAERIKGWCRVVYTDATIALIIGTLVTLSFLLAGAGVLGPRKLAPEGEQVALTLSTIFSSRWGEIGGVLFLISGAAALISTQIGQLAGWPRLLADACRICVPGFKRIPWKTQFRLFLLFFFLSNMIIVFTFGLKPVVLVKLAAVLDGLLLTPLQAIWVMIGLYFIMPRLLSDAARPVLRPHWVFAAGLLLAFLVFGYFCVFQIPYAL
ncbi:MAG: Nramp family divalent metal transporter [Acidobacteriota bacterium]